MLTQEDVQKIVEANQKIFVTKEEAEANKEAILEVISDLQKSVDAYAKKADTYFQEMVMLSHKVDRMEKWMLAMAEKIGMKLDY